MKSMLTLGGVFVISVGMLIGNMDISESAAGGELTKALALSHDISYQTLYILNIDTSSQDSTGKL